LPQCLFALGPVRTVSVMFENVRPPSAGLRRGGGGVVRICEGLCGWIPG
jgi:hypothetical protein